MVAVGGDPARPPSLPSALAPLFDEATDIADRSPASACALMRLLLRAMVMSRGRPGRDLGRDIEEAVLGAPAVLRAMDAIALGPDHSRRPGELDLTQGHHDVQNLAVLVHLLAEHLGGADPA